MRKNVLLRIVCLAVLCTMLMGMLPAMAAKPTLPAKWTLQSPKTDSYTPFKPPHNYSCMQNPPDFTWCPPTTSYDKYTYDLVICKDEELKEVAYEANGLKWHYYNFPYTFEPGVYWWSVRFYESGNKEPSDWAAAKKFRIDQEAVAFTMPSVEEIVQIIPKGHPRMWVTADTMDDFRKRFEGETGKNLYDRLVKSADNLITQPIPKEPEPYYTQAQGATLQEATTDKAPKKSLGYSMGDKSILAATAYLFTGDSKYARYAIDVLLEYATWEYDNTNKNAVSAYAGDDQVFFENLHEMALAYDWCYNEMSPEERKITGDNLRGRFEITREKHLNLIRTSPYDSHHWSYSHCYLVPALALMHDYPGYDKVFTDYLTLYTANSEPMCTEDGGWSKGTAYWTYSFIRGKQFMEVMKEADYIDYYKKAWVQNEYLWAMYMIPKNSKGSFGDGSAQDIYNGNDAITLGLNQLAHYTNNPYAAWARDQIGSFANVANRYNAVLSVGAYDNIEPKVPYDHPNGILFPDQGISVHHSDLVSDNRISMYFRSSQYGSYNHMHADQNSFIIEANGENLATKGGWYDSYHSTHDSGFTRKTYAHNSVTYDFGKGQKDDSMALGGNIDMFATTSAFDVTVGDATPAYVGGIDKFVRSMIYIRPDKYIVIDDLAAARADKGNESFFEWWFNSRATSTLTVHDDNRGAKLVSSKMAMDLRMHYPANLTPYYSNLYSGPDLVNFPTLDSHKAYEPDRRIWFETEPVSKTKIIATMNVHTSTDQSDYVKETNTDTYTKLEFEDGTIAIVNNTPDNDAVIDTGDIQFVGTAVVYSEDDIALIGGKDLVMYGIDLVDAEQPVTVVYDSNGQLVTSSKTDYVVTIHTGNAIIPEITDLQERRVYKTRTPVSKDVTGFGVTYGEGETKGDITIDSVYGSQTMMVNGTLIPGQEYGENATLELVIDGVSNTYTAPLIKDANFEASAVIKAPVKTGAYLLVSSTENVVDDAGFNKYSSTNLGERDIVFNVTGTEPARVEIKTVPVNMAETLLGDDHQAALKTTVAHVKGINFESKTGNTRPTNGLAYLTGISQLNASNASATYKITIPEDGTYNAIIRCAVWQEPWPVRTIEIDGENYAFQLPNTGGWGGSESDFKPVTIMMNKFLKAGEYTFKIGSFNGEGAWNYDWIGFTKVDAAQ